jgi:hypothetical protein
VPTPAAHNIVRQRINRPAHAPSTAHRRRFARAQVAPDALHRRLLQSFWCRRARRARTGIQSRPSISAANCTADSRITLSSLRGQRNLPPSSRLANKHRPVSSQKPSFSLTARERISLADGNAFKQYANADVTPGAGSSNELVVGSAAFGDQEAPRAAKAELTKVSLARSRSSVRRSSKMRIAASGKPIKSLPARLIRSPS